MIPRIRTTETVAMPNGTALAPGVYSRGELTGCDLNFLIGIGHAKIESGASTVLVTEDASREEMVEEIGRLQIVLEDQGEELDEAKKTIAELRKGIDPRRVRIAEGGKAMPAAADPTNDVLHWKATAERLKRENESLRERNDAYAARLTDMTPPNPPTTPTLPDAPQGVTSTTGPVPDAPPVDPVTNDPKAGEGGKTDDKPAAGVQKSASQVTTKPKGK